MQTIVSSHLNTATTHRRQNRYSESSTPEQDHLLGVDAHYFRPGNSGSVCRTLHQRARKHRQNHALPGLSALPDEDPGDFAKVLGGIAILTGKNCPE